MRALLATLAVLLALGGGAPAWAKGAEEQAQLAELDSLRGKVADEIQLAAYDLVDELVYGLMTDPVFDKPTPVVLAGVSVPVGLGTGLEALLENHIGAVLANNPTTNIQLVHCPSCTAVVVHSGPEATVISRGVDDPAVLAELGDATGKHALFIDVEAEGTWLVLRARLTRLSPDLPIVWSHTLASSTSTPALLRGPGALKSAADARKDYVDALHDRGPITVPLRFVVRTYARPPDGEAGVAPPPFVWLQSGIEVGATDARAWTASILLGYSFIPQAYQGVMAQARISRLLTGRVRSHSHPDLYWFTGAAVFSVWGPATAPFQNGVLTSDEIITGALPLGLDLRRGNRIGISSFLETLPSLRKSDNMGNYIRVLGVGFQSLGTEVAFCF